MRDIKFRAWDKRKLHMDYEVTLKLGNISDTAEYALMQYTSLKDKNGVEIYEGDVVKTGKKILGHNNPEDYRNRVMRWSNWRGCWTFDTEDRDKEQSVVWEAAIYDDREVIGNIYENPELLK